MKYINLLSKTANFRLKSVLHFNVYTSIYAHGSPDLIDS